VIRMPRARPAPRRVRCLRSFFTDRQLALVRARLQDFIRANPADTNERLADLAEHPFPDDVHPQTDRSTS